MNNLIYQNVAFISYSHRDMAVAKWLQRRLEGFKLPTEVHNDIDAKSRYLRPVFRDQSDLNTGVLGDELRKHLEQSKYLILICSKNSAQSAWVSDEAKAFVEMGRLDHIIPVIIPGDSTPERELFPEYLRNYFAIHPDKELLGVNIGEIGKEKALIRVVSRMLGVSFDSLWKRHQRQKRVKISIVSIASIFTATCAYLFAIPVNVSVSVNLQKSQLPTGNNVALIVNGGEYTASIDASEFSGIRLPGYSRFGDIDITVSSLFFTTIDTLVKTGFGTERQIDIHMLRDNTFGVFEGEIFDNDMFPLEDVKVTVAGHSVSTDNDGRFSIFIPLDEQREELILEAEHSEYEYKYTGELHSPSRNIKLIMHKK